MKRTIHKLMHRSAIFSTVLLSLVMISIAQTETARIQGTITDSAGAVVPGATVTARDARGRESKAVSNQDGTYAILSLQPGKYQIEVTGSNFKTVKQDITLEVAQNADLNFALQAGAVTETVTITDDVVQVDTSTSAVGDVIQGREAIELPLNGRNVLELARLTPGVTVGVPSGFASGSGGNAETYRGGNTGGAAISVNGQRTQANNYLLDGVDNNESLVNTINIFPPAEGTQEFRVQTSVAPAEFGRGGGGIINAVIRSGTNKFHGSAFSFFRNDNFDARLYNTPKKEFRRGQFGGTVGGPIWKDRVFFFADYEGLRQFLPLGQDLATVPTARERNGDFGELNIQLQDILTGQNVCVTGTTTNGITCVNGNGVAFNRLDLLPGNRLNTVGLAYLRAYPLPNLPGLLQNYAVTRNQTLNSDTYDVKIDANLTSKNQLYGRWSWGRWEQTTSSRLPALPAGFGSGSNPIRTRGAVVGLNTTLSTNWFNELRVQANRINYGYIPPFFDQQISATLGIPNANRTPELGGGALIGGYNGQLEYTGDFGPYIVPQNTYQLVDSLGWIHGKHTLKFGGTILRRDVSLYRPNRGKGYFFLIGNGDPTQCGGSPTTGFEQADVLIGFVCNYQIGPPFGFVGTRNWENGAFFQDDWRATKNLTLNLGLRYEYFTNPTEMHGRQANFNLRTGQLVLASGPKDSQVSTDKNNWGPRFGFAYDIGGKGTSKLSGGYGLFYFLDRGGIDNQLAQNPPYSGFSQFNNCAGTGVNCVRIALSGRAPNGSLDSRLATGSLPIGDVSSVNLANPQNVNILAIKPDNQVSNVHQFNLQYQRQLTGDTALSVAYVGSRGRNLILYYNLNGRIIEQGTNVPCANGATTTPCYTNGGNVTVRDDIGRSQYDSLQVMLERRFTHGWQYRVAYTLSKTKDNGEGAFDSVGDTGINFIEPYATSRLDVPHVLSLESVWDVPYGKGRRWGSDIPSALDEIIGGWQINGIWRFNSGQAFDVRLNGVRMDVTGDPYTGNSRGFYLNRAAFTPAPAGRFGHLERNSLRGPIGNQLNLGITKNFNVWEDIKIQFRTEFFNVFNTPQLTPPNTDWNNAGSFGLLQNAYLFTNRQIQFGARLEF